MTVERRPAVSIIMPTFNSARHIEAAIGSVQAQTLGDWELIVVDGESCDDTQTLIDRAAAGDLRIRPIINRNDRGPAHARATGIAYARGEFVAFLDGDDLWGPEKLERQIEFMRDQHCDLSYTYYRRMAEDGGSVSCRVPAYRSYGFWSALALRGIGTLTVVTRRTRLTDPIVALHDGKHGEDYLWWCLILKQGVRARLVPHELALYRISAGQLSKHRIRHHRSVWRNYRDHLGINPLFAAVLYITYITDGIVRELRMRTCAWARIADEQ